MRTAHAIGIVLVVIVGGLVACGGDRISREVGARCDRTADCADRCLTSSGDYPDGFCTIDCTDLRECPDDSECVAREGGVCLMFCRENADCEFLGPSWVCREEDLRGGTGKVGVCLGS
ncbi:MAG: hypothetical protein H0T89_27070 [Deltaproteobacteria bacterium]|nr:hypothetical protein [Deltaproteobacteria bacterium]MDQ3298990.1 hypothetical protein [Myxococcota bacterium]